MKWTREAVAVGISASCAACVAMVGCTQLLGDFSVGSTSDSGIETDTSTPDTSLPTDGTAIDTSTPKDVNVSQPDTRPPCGHVTESCCASSVCLGTATCCGSTCIDLRVTANNCGACGHDCLTSTCTNAMCDAAGLVTAQATGPTAVQVDGTNFYWGQFNNHKSFVGECNKVTGCPGSPTLLIPSADYIADVALAGSQVFATDFNGSFLDSCSAGGCPTITQFHTDRMEGIDTYKTLVFGASFNQVTQMNQDGTGTIVLGTDGSDVVVDHNGSYVFWTGNTTKSIQVAKVGTASSSSIYLAASATVMPRTLAIDSTNLYWQSIDSSGPPGGVYSCPVSFTCTSPTLLASQQAMGTYGKGSIASDGSNVYWTTMIAGGQAVVRTCATSGCNLAPTDLAAVSASDVGGIAIDAQYVYFAAEWSGMTSIFRVAK